MKTYLPNIIVCYIGQREKVVYLAIRETDCKIKTTLNEFRTSQDVYATPLMINNDRGRFSKVFR